MNSRVQHIRMLLRSTLYLLVAFVAMIMLQWIAMLVGAYISDSEGLIIFKGITPIAKAEVWSRPEVLWMYLMPYAFFVVLFTLFVWQRRYPTVLPAWLQLLQSWSYVVLLITVFFMPLCEILNKSGIYHALNWLQIDRELQLIIGIFMWLIFLARSLHISVLFSTSLNIPSSKVVGPKQIIKQLPFLWYIPFIILISIIYLLSNFTIPVIYHYFLSGITFLLLINTWLISRYNVIVK